MLGKITWELSHDSNKIWATIFKEKYLKESSILHCSTSVSDSYVWRGIIKATAYLKEGFKFRIGDGKGVSVWKDRWVNDSTLLEFVDPNSLDTLNLDMHVDELIVNKRWFTDPLAGIISDHFIQRIESIPIPLRGVTHDRIVWNGDVKGKYTPSSGYSFLMRSLSVQDHDRLRWKWVWRLRCPEATRHLIWTCLHGALPTNEFRFKRGLGSSVFCTRCNNAPETILHCLRDCEDAWRIWVLFGFNTSQNFRTDDLWEWLHSNAMMLSASNSSDITFLCIFWWLWRWRNDSVLGARDLTLQGIAKIIESWAVTHRNVFMNDPTHSIGSPRVVQWTKPDTGSFKINTDGSSFGNPGPAGFGGLIRDENGVWLSGFSGSLGVSTCMHAELAAILQGLTMAKEMGIVKAHLESDSQEAVNIILHGDCETHHYSSIIQDIRWVLTEENFSISHILREANFCADALAKLGARSSVKLSIWEDPLLSSAISCFLTFVVPPL